MQMPRVHRMLALALLMLYLPLVASIDLWHDHGGEDEHESCAACHFAASHALVIDAIVLTLEGAESALSGMLPEYVFEIAVSPNSRAPPCVLSSLVIADINTMNKDTRDERIFHLRGAAFGVRMFSV